MRTLMIIIVGMFLSFQMLYAGGSCTLGTNIIKNSSFESSDSLSNWTKRSGSAKLVIAKYSQGWAGTAPVGAGSSFLYATGGSNTLIVDQTIDISGCMDGDRKYDFSSFLGGYIDGDSIAIKLEFKDDNDAVVQTYDSGDFKSDTKIMLAFNNSESLSNSITKLTVTLTFKRVGGTDIDGYIDNLSIVIKDDTKIVPPPTTCIMGTNIIENSSFEDSDSISSWIKDSADAKLMTAPYATGWAGTAPAEAGSSFLYATGAEVLTVSKNINIEACMSGEDRQYNFSSFLGGYGDGDKIAVKLEFKNASGLVLKSYNSGDYTSTNVMKLFTKNEVLPSTITQLVVSLTFTRVGGTDIDGYIDNLSVIINSISEKTPAEIAEEKIIAYAADGSNPVPTVEDYEVIGVIGVTSENIDIVNRAIDAAIVEEVDSLEELNNLIKSVIDTTAPILTLKGLESITLVKNEKYIELGADAEDNVDGILSVDISGEVDISRANDYIITYKAEDAAGNKVSKTRTVHVVLSVVGQLLEDAAQGSNLDVHYIVVGDSTRNYPFDIHNTILVDSYYPNQLNRIHVAFAHTAYSGIEAYRWKENISSYPGGKTKFKLDDTLAKIPASNHSNYIVEFSLGINDSYYKLATTKAELKTIIRSAVEILHGHRQNLKILMVSPVAYTLSDTSKITSEVMEQAYKEVYSELIAQGATYLSFVSGRDATKAVPDCFSSSDTCKYYGDSIHPAEDGSLRLVNYIFSEIGGSSVHHNMTVSSADSPTHMSLDEMHVDLDIRLEER